MFDIIESSEKSLDLAGIEPDSPVCQFESLTTWPSSIYIHKI